MLINLREKMYEEGWLKDHDRVSQNYQNELRIDLKQSGVSMQEILKFNELLFQQISNRKDEKLSFEGCKKNYLLVPLKKHEGEFKYELDFELVRQMTDQTKWVTV